MQYVMRIFMPVRCLFGLSALCALGLGLGGCVKMNRNINSAVASLETSFEQGVLQDNTRQQNRPVMPEDRLRSYDQGNVVVYPLQGPVPSEPADSPYSTRAPNSSYDDPAVTVYSLEGGRAQSIAPVQNTPLKSQAQPLRQKQSTKPRSPVTSESFEGKARQDAATVPLAAGGQDGAPLSYLRQGVNAGARKGDDEQTDSAATGPSRYSSGNEKKAGNQRLLTAP